MGELTCSDPLETSISGPRPISLILFFSSFYYTRLEREQLLLTFLSSSFFLSSPPLPSFPSPPPPFLTTRQFLRRELSLVYEAEKTVDCTITVDHFFSQLHQLSSRAVSVSSRFDVLPFRRLLTQTANSPLSDYRCPIRDIDG